MHDCESHFFERVGLVFFNPWSTDCQLVRVDFPASSSNRPIDYFDFVHKRNMNMFTNAEHVMFM